MSNPFEAFGIEVISPSQINAWNDDRGVWYAKARGRVYDDAGPAAWRGDAIEGGLWSALTGRAPQQTADEIFEARSAQWSKDHDGEVHPQHDEEYAKIGPALERAIEACEREGVKAPDTYQGKVKGYLPGFDAVQVYGKFDFGYGAAGKGSTLDLKTTKSIPSVPKDGGDPQPEITHAIQASIYAAIRGDDQAQILYVSTADKPRDTYRLITLDSVKVRYYVNAAVQTLMSIGDTLHAAIAMCDYEMTTPEAALARLCRPNLLARGGGFYPVFKPDFQRAACEAVPAWGLHEGAQQ